jgi:hypothetical protein
MLEISYMIPQRGIHDGQGEMILQIEGVQPYGSNFAIHPM